MTREEVKQEAVSVLRELQVLSGDAAPVITAGTRPLKDLKDFDSHRDLEFSITIAARLGVDAETRWCLGPDNKSLLSVDEIVDRLKTALEA